MKVALIADIKSLESGTGIARYDHELCRGLRERGVDVRMLSVAPFSVPFGEAFTHAFRLPWKVLCSVRDVDLVHATAPITALSFPLIQKPKVITYHDLIALRPEHSGNAFHARLFAPAFFRIGNWSDCIIANSTQTRDDIAARLGFPEKKLRVINLGVSPEFGPLEKEEGAFFSIGYIGALAPRKRLDYLVNTLHFLKQNHSDVKVKLLLYGRQASACPDLAKQVRTLNLGGDVEFKGFVPQERLVEAYNSLDIFVLASEWEGFGLPILEAQRCGVPVVVRLDAHIPLEVSKCAVKAKSETEASDAIYELLTNRDLRKSVVEAGLKHSGEFTWDKTVRETVDVYEALLS